MVPSSEAVSRRMSRLGRRDTAPELALRRELHARGLRTASSAARSPASAVWADIVFGPARVVVYVDGCCWHGCPIHGTAPRTNAEFWSEKLEWNRQRDRRTDDLLAVSRWQSVRVWEHEDMRKAAERIAAVVEE